MEGTLSPADIAVLSGNGRNNDNDGFGTGGAWWVIIFLIFAFGGWGNRGYGFGGGSGSGTESTSVYEGYVLNNDFSQLSRQLSDATAMTERKLDGVNNGLCTLGYQELQNINGVNTNIFNATSGIQNTLTQGFAGLNTGMVQQGYETRIGINGVGTQLADCCCKLQADLANVNYNNATNACAIKTAISDGIRDVMANCNNNYRSLHDEIVANRIEDKNAQISLLQNQLNKAELTASQSAQNEYLINKLRPCPIPAYASCNPWGCNCNQGCGCNY